MKASYFAEQEYVPAGHENPHSIGVFKKVLFCRDTLQAGRTEFVNWARLPPGKTFAPHYHETMQEVFVIIHGEAEIHVDGQTAVLRRGDAVVVNPREIHEMRNCGSSDVEYIALGISIASEGKTVLATRSQCESSGTGSS